MIKAETAPCPANSPSLDISAPWHNFNSVRPGLLISATSWDVLDVSVSTFEVLFSTASKLLWGKGLFAKEEAGAINSFKKSHVRDISRFWILGAKVYLLSARN